MKYVKQSNSQWVPVKQPEWFDESGNPIDDVLVFIESGGIYPLVDIMPEYDEANQNIQKNLSEQWEVKSDHVAVTYTIWPKTQEEQNEYFLKQRAQLATQTNDVRYSKIYQDSIPYTFTGDTEPDGIQMRNEVDRQNIQDLVIDASLREPTDTMQFMPTSNVLKTLTAQDIVDMGRYLKTRGDQIVGYSWTLKGQIAAAATIEDLPDINVGWPT